MNYDAGTRKRRAPGDCVRAAAHCAVIELHDDGPVAWRAFVDDK